MAQRGEAGSTKSAMARFREVLLKSYDDELVNISLKRAAMVAAAAARAAMVSVELSYSAVVLASTRGESGLAPGRSSSGSSHGPRAA